MTQTIGLIEIEADARRSLDRLASADDTNLDALFARLVRGDSADESDCESSSAIVLSANLEVLKEDLALATRQILGEIFLSRGSR
jgi:hypothetical protein